ncbi:hypothetical protein BDZ45DRAFT_744311 [Acephala macrosclerotiorum]|nr:hypothetical protein BDZ45DRAFT_744311 [Acephala macrosclerotiorum]
MDSPPSPLVESFEFIDDEYYDELNFSDRTERLTLSDQAYNADIESPNDMQLDSEELLNDAEKDDTDVAIINPDEALPRADDFETMKEIVLPPLHEQPPILQDVVHTWHITEWDQLRRREEGPVFEAGGHPWRVLMFPNGNNVDYASFYLEHGYGDGPNLPEDFACCVQFGLVLWNTNNPEIFQHHTAHHRFTKEEGDWGFTRFVEHRKLWTVPWEHPSGACIADGYKANMTAYVRIVKDETGVLWHNFTNYDSKKETGYVGLKNQGATCYLNSLIQSLYFTNAFRKAVYQIPTQDEESLTNSAYTLQRLFYQLQTSNNAVGTNELTKSFGWETRHIFEQQDVQELSRKLMERMEEKMKGTEAQDILPRLFCGKVRTYISCINVDYESRRSEDFWDIQLNVSGNKNLEESFKDYVQVEVMNGENQYFAGDEHKLQDANKGVIFESFPEVLHLQLKRFQYDIDRDAMMKINDRYEFPETFDAAPYLAENLDMSEPWIYQLHGVLVHSGDLNAGHYYAFIKPTKDGWFYKYDDDKVTKATMREVLEDNFGGEYLLPNGSVAFRGKAKPLIRQNSAYMLVYIRQTRVDKVLLPVTQEDTPAHLQRRLDEEAAMREARKKEREEQHLYLGIRVITNDTFRAHGGTDLTVFDQNANENPAAARYYRLLKKSTIKDLITRIGEDTETDPRRIRLWCMVNRQNKTTRPDTPITDNNVTVEDAHQRLTGSKGADLRLWAEVADEVTADGEPIWPATPGQVNGNISKSDAIVLFLKRFDYERQSLNGVGHIYISREKKVEDLVPAITKKLGWHDEKLQLRLWEEIKPSMIEPMKGKQSLKAAELQDGDIICFQVMPSDLKSESDSSVTRSLALTTLTDDRRRSIKSETIKSERSSSLKPGPDRIEDAKAFYDFLLHKREVRFYPHPSRNANPALWEPFPLILNSKNTYDQVATRVGEYLKVDPTHLRFWTCNATNGNPKASVKRGLSQSLQTILNPPYSTFSNNNQRADSLYFEVLDISLSELDTKKVVKVTWLSEGQSKMETFDLLVPKSGIVDDIIHALIKKANLEDETKAGPIRVYEVHSSKIHKELTREHQVLGITDYINLVAERIPEEEELPIEDLKIVQAVHFDKEPNKGHGVPFRFQVIRDEPFTETKKRLEKRTGYKGKNFEKIKFAIVKQRSYSKPVYLADDAVLYDLISEDDMLGLDHVDRQRSMRNGVGDLFLK